MDNKNLKVVNLFAGPGAGKSTTASGLFYWMKTHKHLVEITNEAAKDFTWDERFNLLRDDQLYVTAKQNRRLQRLVNKVEIAITDSPLMLGMIYANEMYLPNHYKNLVLELFNSYDNYNYFVVRKKEYVQVGRTQTLEQATTIDQQILELLEKYKIPYTAIPGDPSGIDKILHDFKKEKDE